MAKITNYISTIEPSFELAKQRKSKASDGLLQIDGMKGQCTRHFYNNTCSMADARYLEIGTWAGSSLCSAMEGNSMTSVAIDNWSEYRDPKEHFLRHLEQYRGNNNVRFIEKNG